jgi:hypothetical protein
MDVHCGHVMGSSTDRRTQIDMVAFMERVAQAHPKGRVHTAWDNCLPRGALTVTVASPSSGPAAGDDYSGLAVRRGAGTAAPSRGATSRRYGSLMLRSASSCMIKRPPYSARTKPASCNALTAALARWRVRPASSPNSSCDT